MEQKTKKTPNQSIIKIVLFGPESTGKTTLAQQLANHFKTSWAPEYMREFLQTKWDTQQKTCSYNDLETIAVGQIKNENIALKTATKVVFFDTNLKQLKVYAKLYYDGQCPELICREEKTRKYHFYFLLKPDIPWVADDLRDKPNERNELFQLFKAELDQSKEDYKIIKGNFKERTNIIIKEVEKLIKLHAQ